MIKTKNVEKIACVFLIAALFMVSFIASVNAHHIQQSTSQVYRPLSYKQLYPVWEVEYGGALAALRVATDSENNVILVGPGGETVTELPYGAIVKYGPNGDFIWSDHRLVSIIDGSVSQSCKTVSIKQSSNKIIADLTKRYQYLKSTFSFPKAQRLFGKWVRFYDVVVDSNDDIIVVGEIQHRLTEELRTVYVIKYNSDGHVLWDRIYKRYWLTPRDLATGVAIDSKEDIFVSIKSKEKNSDDYKGWILKLSSNSGLKLGESIYHGKTAIFYDVAVDSEDNVFVAGHYPTSGAMKVVKYSNDLTLLNEWGPSILPIEPHAIDVDPNDNIIVAGHIGFPSQKKQYVVKFSSDGNVLWSNKSTESGILYDVVALSHNVTAVTGVGGGEMAYKFYVGLYDENGRKFKSLLGGNSTPLQMFESCGLDVDNNGDIVVSGFRNYGYYQYYMYGMKFHQ